MVVHKQHDDVGERAANLEAEAPASDSHKHRSAPAVGGAAGRQALAVGASEYKRGFLLAWNDRDALRLFQKLTGDALLGRSHDLLEDLSRFLNSPGVVAAVRRQ